MDTKYYAGQIVRYIRTGAIYLLLEEVEISMLSPHFYTNGGKGFRAYVIYSGRSWSKVADQKDIWIKKTSEYYEVLSYPGDDQTKE